MDVNVRVYVSELDLGLKKDVFSSDGSSLEALLKGEPVEKRSGLELRTAEEEPSSTEYSSGGLNTSSRVRKVLRKHDIQNIHWNHNYVTALAGRKTTGELPIQTSTDSATQGA